MGKALLSLCCFVLALSAVARADLDKGAWAPDIEAKEWVNTDEPISLYECRGMVVVVVFWVTWAPGAENVMPLMNLVGSEFGRQKGVFIVGLTDVDLKRMREMLEKERVLFPVGTGSKSYEEYKVTQFPRAVLIDPKGKVAWTGWPTGEELVSQIREVIAETPPTRTHPTEAIEAQHNLAQARAALREKDFRKARRVAEQAFERSLTGDALKAQCQGMVDLIEALGRDRLAQAEAAVEDRRFGDAVGLLRSVKRDFRGADVAATAARRLKTIEKKYKEAAELMSQQHDETIAENLLYEALQGFREREFGAAYEKLQTIAEDYEDSPAAERAKVLMDRVKAHPDVWAYVQDHLAGPECRTLLSQARAYEQQGRINTAREKYQLVLEKYPDTVWADRARERLIYLR